MSTFDWTNANDDETCSELQRLDVKFDTDSRSPLSHAYRCPLHGGIHKWARKS